MKQHRVFFFLYYKKENKTMYLLKKRFYDSTLAVIESLKRTKRVI